jgi:hypothetical protein
MYCTGDDAQQTSLRDCTQLSILLNNRHEFRQLPAFAVDSSNTTGRSKKALLLHIRIKGAIHYLYRLSFGIRKRIEKLLLQTSYTNECDRERL